LQSPGLRFLGLGLELAAAVAGLTLAGVWFDRHFDTAPWGSLVGAGLGLVGGTYNMIREALATSGPDHEPADAEPDRGPDGPSSEERGG
jgi:F0F1-type ATP synthase assembly protein I